MKRFLKSSLSIFLAITIIFSSAIAGLGEIDFGKIKFGNPFAVKSKAADVSNLTFSLNIDTASYSVLYCETSASGEIVVPSTYYGKPVTKICYDAFEDCASLTSVTIPDSVTSIGDRAFAGCSKLTSIKIPDSVTSIGNAAFYNTGYYNDSSNWENGVLYIGSHLIDVKSLSGEYIIKDGTKTVADHAFYYCTSLTSLTIPDSVTSIGYWAFYGCQYLESITISDSVASIGDEAFYDTGYYNDSSNWENDVIYIGNHLIKANNSLSGKYIIKDRTKTVADHAFYYCSSLTSITIPDSVTTIGNAAFAGCSKLTSIKIPDGVTTIGESAFGVCDSLTSVTIPDSVTSMGKHAFYNCTKIESVYITDIAAWCNIDFCGSESNPILFIGKVYLNGELVTELVIPDGVTSIGKYAFDNCDSLTSVTIPDSVTSIDNFAFAYCDSLTSVTISDGVKSIGDSAFEGCSSLTSITIPDSVTSIGGKAFNSCTKLGKVNWNAKNVADFSKSSDVFYNSGTTCGGVDFVFGDTVEFIPANLFCVSNTKSVTIGDSVKSIASSTFKDFTELTSITIGDGVTSIGSSAFEGCTKLSSITIGDSVTSIGKEAFYDCRSLKSITIPDSVTSIGSSAFESCYSLSKVVWNAKNVADFSRSSDTFFNAGTTVGGMDFIFGDTVESIPANLCYWENSGYNDSLKSVTISDSVKRIGYSAFESCTSLWSITIGDSVTSIGDYAFYGCEGIYSITIPDSVTYMGEDAFYNTAYYNDGSNWGKDGLYICNHLIEAKTSLSGAYEIKEGTKTIAPYAFYDCSELTSLVIPSSVVGIGRYAFYNCNNITSVFATDLNSWCNINFAGDYSNPLRSATYFYVNGSFVKNFIIPDGVESVKPFVFDGYKSLASVTIPDSVTSIGSSAFSGCTGLTSITIPDGVTSIGERAFYDCTSLASVYVTDIATWCNIKFYEGYSNPLYYARKLYINGSLATDIIIPDNITRLNSFVFYNCNSLTSIIIPDNVISIGKSAFCKCSSLKSVTIPDSVTSLGDYTFRECTSLTSVTIGDSVTSIGEEAFFCCERLTSITIPHSVTCISNYAFGSCSYLKYIFYTGTVQQWLKIAVGTDNTYLTDNIIHFNSTGHTAGDWIVDKEATCTKEGSRHTTCLICEAVVTEIISATGHIGVKDVAIAATCTKAGKTEGSHCSVCNTVIKAQETIPANGHKYSDWNVTSKPNCEGGGMKNKICSTCGDVVTETVAPLGHDYEAEWTVDETPTCTENGSKSRHCSRCDAKKDVKVLEATGHSYGEWNVIKEATCTESGTKTKTCSGCGDAITEKIPATNHNYSDWVIEKEPTCDSAGKCSKICTACGDVYFELVPSTGHTSSDWITDKKATVNAKGKKHKECTECGEVLETATIPQLKAAKPKLSKIENTSSGVKITWGKVSGADKYYVYRKTSGGSYSRIGSTANTYYTDKTAKSGKKYYYIVKAINEAGGSDSSSSKSIYHLADTTLKTPSSTKSGIVLKWSKVTGAEGYMVYRKTGSGSYSKIATVKGNTKITYTDKSAKKGKKYTYKIKAYKSKTYSAYSNTKTITDKY